MEINFKPLSELKGKWFLVKGVEFKGKKGVEKSMILLDHSVCEKCFEIV